MRKPFQSLDFNSNQDSIAAVLEAIIKETCPATILDIGAETSSTATQAILKNRNSDSKLFAIQTLKTQLENLKTSVTNSQTLFPCLALDIPWKKAISENAIRTFYTTHLTPETKIPLNSILKRRADEEALFRSSGLTDSGISQIKKDHEISTFDLVVVRGNFVSGISTLDEIKGANWIVLKETVSIIGSMMSESLKEDPSYELICENQSTIEGFAVFKKADNLEERSKKSPQNSNRVKKVLIVRTDAIGDNILGTGLLPSIRNHFTGAEISLLCQDMAKDAYHNSPYVDRIITFKRSEVENSDAALNTLLEKLKTLGVDVVINPLWSPEVLTHILVMGAQAKIAIGHYGNLSNISAANREKLSPFYSVLAKSEGEFEIETRHNQDLLSAMGCQESLKPSNILLTDNLNSYASKIYQENGLIPQESIAFFVSANPTIKARNYDRFRDVLKLIHSKYGFSVVALGAPRDYVLAAEATNVYGMKVLNLCGLTSISEASAIISQARASLGVDTSLSHIACAVGTPNTVILGGGHFGRFFPYSNLTSVAALPLQCFGCNWSCRYESAHCVKEISPEIVFKAFEHSLEKQDAPAIFVQRQSDYSPSAHKPAWNSNMVSKRNALNIIEDKAVSLNKPLTIIETSPLGLFL